MRIRYQISLWPLNWLCFVIGMVMVWRCTHRWDVLAWAFVASLHFTSTALIKVRYGP